MIRRLLALFARVFIFKRKRHRPTMDDFLDWKLEERQPHKKTIKLEHPIHPRKKQSWNW